MAKKDIGSLLEGKTVLFVSFSKWLEGKRMPTNGSIEPMRDFMVPYAKRFVLIDQTHPGSDDVMPKIEVYSKNNKDFKSYNCSFYLYLLKPLLNKFNTSTTQPIFKVRDFLSVIDWSFRDKTTFDYCICLESINTIAAIFLRKIGRVKKVVYYVSDYSPNRYPGKIFNNIYLFLDRFCAMHADYIWDVSKAMQPARISVGLNSKKSAPVIHVPNGLYPDQIKANPISKIENHSMVYMGTLGQENGPDIAILSLELVMKKFPDAKLNIIGGTAQDFEWLKKIVQKKGLEKSVNVHGFVEKSSDMSDLIRNCTVGLAPYRDIPGSLRYYADAGKIRVYAAAGISIVCSQVPPLGVEVAEKGAALRVHDDPKSFADAVINIFSDKKLYLRLRKNAMEFAEHNTWENSFANAFRQMNGGI